MATKAAREEEILSMSPVRRLIKLGTGPDYQIGKDASKAARLYSQQLIEAFGKELAIYEKQIGRKVIRAEDVEYVFKTIIKRFI